MLEITVDNKIKVVAHEIQQDLYDNVKTKMNLMGAKIRDRAKDLTPTYDFKGDISMIPEKYKPEILKVGGTLKRNWKRTDVKTKVLNNEDIELSMVIYNNIEYAEYVEYGHRQEVGRFVPQINKKLKQPFVLGRHMLTKAILQEGNLEL